MSDLYSGPEIAPADILSVYVVMNGPLGMSDGKMAAMAFHCGWRILLYGTNHPRFGDALGAWIQQGKRVVLRVAETPHVFERVCNEVDGFACHDEGLTEVEHGACVAFVTRPYRRADAPQILAHKRCQLL